MFSAVKNKSVTWNYCDEIVRSKDLIEPINEGRTRVSESAKKKCSLTGERQLQKIKKKVCSREKTTWRKARVGREMARALHFLRKERTSNTLVERDNPSKKGYFEWLLTHYFLDRSINFVPFCNCIFYFVFFLLLFFFINAFFLLNFLLGNFLFVLWFHLIFLVEKRWSNFDFICYSIK